MGFIPGGGVRVGFEAEKSRRLLNVRVAQQRTDRDEPHLFSSPSAGQLAASLGELLAADIEAVKREGNGKIPD